MTWDQWIVRHAQLFGLVQEGDMLMVQEWGRLFAADGYTPSELMAATEWLATKDPPKFRNEHLRALVDRLKTARTDGRSAGLQEPAADQCRLCGGSGYVCGLPNVEAIERTGRWYTCCVFCKCPLGKWKKGHSEVNIMGFEQYDATYSDWRERLRARKEQDARHLQASARATSLDRALGAILGRASAGRNSED